jgi:hypothetical protein
MNMLKESEPSFKNAFPNTMKNMHVYICANMHTFVHMGPYMHNTYAYNTPVSSSLKAKVHLSQSYFSSWYNTE